MNEIVVKSEKLKEAVAAFEVLFERKPLIFTNDRSFEDCSENTCWGRVPVVSVSRTLFVFACDGTTYKAPIKNVKEFRLK